MFRQIGAPEIILILAVVVLLFGAKKLPELARGSGRALRIFKSETKGLLDDDAETESAAAEPKAITPTEAAPTTSTVAETAPVEGERRPDTTA